MPTKHNLSTLRLRAGLRNSTYAMPPLGSNLPNTVGNDLLAEWIDSMSATCPSTPTGVVLPAVINAVNYDRVFDVDTGSGCKLFWLPDSCFVVSSLVPWFEYYVNIPSEKDLNITLSMTTGLVPKWGTRYVSVSIDGIDVAKNIAVINEGIMDAGWQKINLYTVKGIHMTSGNHIVRVSFENGGTAFKFIQFN